MTNAQKVNKHQKTKRIKSTTTKGSRARRRQSHGIGKSVKSEGKKRKIAK